MKNLNVFMPACLEGFRCVGSDCEDSCCVGWWVNVDKKSYQRYKGYTEDPQLRLLFDKNIRRNSKSTGDSDYAKVVFQDIDRRCPFLDESMLCSIQCKLGHDALCALCQQYPRSFVKIDGDVEYSASLGCPEVCRLVLLNRRGLELKKDVVSVSDKQYFHSVYNTNDIRLKFKKLQKYFMNIKLIVLSIMECRSYDIETRLSIIAIFIDKLKCYNVNTSDGDLVKLLDSFSDVDFLNRYAVMLGERKAAHKKLYYQLKYLKVWADECYKVSRNAKFVENLNVAMEWLSYLRLDSEVLDEYENVGIVKYRMFMRDRSYILENYLSLSLFSGFVPVLDLFDRVTTVVSLYVLLRNIFIGLLIANVELTDEKCVEVIQCFSKTIGHNQSFLEKIMAALDDEDRYSLAHVMIMLNIG